MLTRLQQKVLKNVIDSVNLTDNECTINFSRLDKAEIMVVKHIFDLDCKLKNLNESDCATQWSKTVNSSALTASYKAQAQYVEKYMPEIFPDLTKKSSMRM